MISLRLLKSQRSRPEIANTRATAVPVVSPLPFPLVPRRGLCHEVETRRDDVLNAQTKEDEYTELQPDYLEVDYSLKTTALQ